VLVNDKVSPSPNWRMVFEGGKNTATGRLLPK
jgi:hypothetical protein